MEKFKGFKIGQEFEIVDATCMGVCTVYEESDKMLVTSVTSTGVAFCDKSCSYFPEWVNEGYLKLIKDIPKVSPKITPRNLGCFEEVANVIGEECAEEELQKVIDLGLIDDFDVELELLQAFRWSESSQGDYFWDCIHDGDVPDGYTPKGNSFSGALHSFSIIDESKEYSSNHYNFQYELTDIDIQNGFIKIDPYFVNKAWSLNTKDDTGILFHQLKTIARFGDKNSIEREIKAMYSQVKRMAEMYDVNLEN